MSIMNFLRGIQDKPEPPDHFEIWQSFATELKQQINETTQNWELIFIVDGAGACRQKLEGREYIVIAAQDDCHQLESYGCESYRRAGKMPADVIIHANIIGIDQRGFVYVDTKLESAVPRSKKCYRIDFAEDWQTPRPLNLAKRIKDGLLDPFDIQAFDPVDLLNENNLKKLSEWAPLVPGYDRNVAETDCWPINRVINPLIDKIGKEPGLSIRILENGGLGVYFSVFICNASARKDYHDTPGIVLYFCLIAPVAVMGRASGCFGPDYSSLNFENIIDPEAATGSIEGMLIKVLEKPPYTLPGSDQLNHPLPAGIEPTEYCFCAEPWDKVFHLLMQMTD